MEALVVDAFVPLIDEEKQVQGVDDSNCSRNLLDLDIMLFNKVVEFSIHCFFVLRWTVLILSSLAISTTRKWLVCILRLRWLSIRASCAQLRVSTDINAKLVVLSNLLLQTLQILHDSTT